MRIIFMGTPEYAVEILRALSGEKTHKIVGVFTQPDKPVGRKKIMQSPPVKLWAQEHLKDIPLFQPSSLKSQESVDAIWGLKPDMIIVAAFGQLLPKNVLDIAPCVNLHASLLPLYRGASPIQHAILDAQKYTGVTAMLMDVGLDTGAMLGFSIVGIKEDDNSPKMFDLLAKKAANLTLRILELWPDIEPITQSNTLSSYAPKITKNDGFVSWDWSSEKIWSHYLALSPWPGIFTNSGLKLLEISLSKIKTDKNAGEIIAIEEDGVHVACSVGAIFVQRVQAPSKKPLHVKDYLQGQRRGVGDILL